MHEDPRSGVGVTLDVAQGGHQAVRGVGGGGRGELGEEAGRVRVHGQVRAGEHREPLLSLLITVRCHDNIVYTLCATDHWAPHGVPGLASVEADSGHQGADTLNPAEAGGGGQPHQHRGVAPHEGGRTQPGLAPSLLPRDEELDNSETMIKIIVLRI